MFGFSLAVQLFQGSAERTWNCVTNITNLLWYKFNHFRYPTMPRSRRRHHSRSRSRSRSHSHDRDREPKRRKIADGVVESPLRKRSVSCEPSIRREEHENVATDENCSLSETEIGKYSGGGDADNEVGKKSQSDDLKDGTDDGDKIPSNELEMDVDNVDLDKDKNDAEVDKNKSVDKQIVSDDSESKQNEDIDKEIVTSNESNDEIESQNDETIVLSDENGEVPTLKSKEKKTPAKLVEEKVKLTPSRSQSPKQIQKRLESEKKKQQKQQEREEREKKRLEEKEERERQRLEKLKEKKEKEEQKLRERAEKEREREMKNEQRRKEKEEKEVKRKEKEEREEQKRKERELEKLRKQQETDEKLREKQKIEELNKKASAAFVNFFAAAAGAVVKKPEKLSLEPTANFMPFQLKSGMRLPPQRRECLIDEEKDKLSTLLASQDDNASYLSDIKAGKTILKCVKTWQEDADNIDDDFGEKICETLPKSSQKIKAKLLKFHENRRPAYYGTWRKRSQKITARKPLERDSALFDYDYDSDEDWEEEEQGESLNGSDDEEKENENEKDDDYEVDNDFFVPHGHLSDDEIDDEATAKLSPESQKQKLKLLKDEFDEDMKMKTNKIKPRSIGCIWYNKDGSNVDESIDKHLRPLAIITNGPIVMKKRQLLTNATPSKSSNQKELNEDLVPMFLQLIHGNTSNRKAIVEDFVGQLQTNNMSVECSKTYLGKKLKEFAHWKKCIEDGPMLNKMCWIVDDEVKKKYNADIVLSKSAKK